MSDNATYVTIIVGFLAFVFLLVIAGGVENAMKGNSQQSKYEACLKAQALQVSFDLKCIEIIKEKS